MITWRKLGSLSTLYLPEVTGRELDVLMDQHGIMIWMVYAMLMIPMMIMMVL